jgi:hypothetical protein
MRVYLRTCARKHAYHVRPSKHYPTNRQAQELVLESFHSFLYFTVGGGADIFMGHGTPNYLTRKHKMRNLSGRQREFHQTNLSEPERRVITQDRGRFRSLLRLRDRPRAKVKQTGCNGMKPMRSGLVYTGGTDAWRLHPTPSEWRCFHLRPCKLISQNIVRNGETPEK